MSSKTGVTTILKTVLGNSEGLMRWANKMGLQGMTMEQARSRNRKAGIGVHDVLERAARELRRPDGGDLDEQAWLHVIAGARASESKAAPVIASWIDDTRPLFVDVERNVSGIDWQGRVDYTRMCSDCGRVIVGDLKPSGPYVDAHFQVAAYIAAIESSGGLLSQEADSRVCHGELVVYGDGWRVYRALATVEDWNALMETYRALDRVRRRMLNPA